MALAVAHGAGQFERTRRRGCEAAGDGELCSGSEEGGPKLDAKSPAEAEPRD